MAAANILLPTDFTECSVRAARVARELVQVSGASVHLLYVWHAVQIAIPAPEVGVAATSAARHRRAAECAGRVRGQRHLAAAGVSIMSVLRAGQPPREIVRYATAARVDRIIMATRGRGILHRILGRSVSHFVLNRAPCAVVVVPPVVALPGEDGFGQWNVPPGLVPAS